MAAVSLDDLDFRLIELLAHDARISNRKIASQLGVTEGTVRSRIKRLERDKLIRFTAVTSMGGAQRVRMAFIRIQAELSEIPEIVGKLRDMPAVGAILVTMGRFNLLVIYLFEELDDLHNLASGTLMAMPGVHHVETAIAMNTLKYDYRVARILD
jgi:Lrp/AsnC family transcriptional regulator, regulator for asnA, asnC and gidA